MAMGDELLASSSTLFQMSFPVAASSAITPAGFPSKVPPGVMMTLFPTTKGEHARPKNPWGELCSATVS